MFSIWSGDRSIIKRIDDKQGEEIEIIMGKRLWNGI